MDANFLTEMTEANVFLFLKMIQKTIRIIAGDAMPLNKRLSSQDVFNIKKKINRLVPRMKGCKDFAT